MPHHVFAELSVAYPSVQGQASYGKATAQGRKREDEEEGGEERDKELLCGTSPEE